MFRGLCLLTASVGGAARLRVAFLAPSKRVQGVATGLGRSRLSGIGSYVYAPRLFGRRASRNPARLMTLAIPARTSAFEAVEWRRASQTAAFRAHRPAAWRAGTILILAGRTAIGTRRF